MIKEEIINTYNNYKSNLSYVASDIVNGQTSDLRIINLYKKLIYNIGKIDFTLFTIDELYKLDFNKWDDNLILMPLWAIDCLPIGIEVYSINSNKIIIDENSNLDKEARYGLSVYGFLISDIIKNKREYRINKLLKVE